MYGSHQPKPPPYVKHRVCQREDNVFRGYSALSPAIASTSGRFSGNARSWVTEYSENGFSSARYTHRTGIDDIQMEEFGEGSGSADVGEGSRRHREHEECDVKFDSENPVQTQIGIYGWRKRCLYLLLFMLLIIVTVNFGITLWFITSLRIHSGGIGNMKILDSGILVDGIAYFMDNVITSKIQSGPDESLSVVTSDKFTVSIRNAEGREVSNFVLTNDTANFVGKALSVKNENGETIFSVDKDSLVYGANEIRLTGKGGPAVTEGIQTPLIKGHFKEDLNVLSLQRKVEVIGSLGVSLTAYAGDVVFSCLSGVKIKSVDGSVKLDSRRIFMPNLPIAKETATPSCSGVEDNNSSATGSSGYLNTRKYLPAYNVPGIGLVTNIKTHSVYQVCLCGNGKFFVAPSDKECTADNDSFICR